MQALANNLNARETSDNVSAGRVALLRVGLLLLAASQCGCRMRN